jgi:chemosensory pili system protein ChpA (sensor histidine kinase/response regulator)
MDWGDIERLREPGFTVARRGYDQREVDRLLGSLADWLEGDAAAQLTDLTVKRKLELVGRSTTRILLTTEQEAEQLRRRTEGECVELRSEAEAAAVETRRAAEAHARTVREKADQDARGTREAAIAKAKQIVEEGEGRRARIEAVIAELDARRRGSLGELERLQAALAATIAEHRHDPLASKPNADKRRERSQTQTESDAVGKPSGS